MARIGKTYITALDIGSSKTTCFIAEVTSHGGLNIVGIGHQLSAGVKSGMITDIKLTENSVRAAVAAAEQMAGVNVDRVVVNISACNMESHTISVVMPLSGHEITARDIHRLIDQATAQIVQDDIEIIHAIPTEYSIDNMKGIKDPSGMQGRVLAAEMHVVTAPRTALLNITGCLARCHLDVEDFIISPYASAISCLNEDEKQLGSILIDFGAGNTSFAIFKHGNMLHADYTLASAMHITSDLAIGLATSVESAERIKNLYGSVISTSRDEREIIDIPQIGDDGRSEMNHVQRSNLVSIIKPRVDEIMEMLSKKIASSPYSNIGGNIIITGGGSQLAGLKELAAHHFKRQVRQGLPTKIDGMAESTKGPIFATVTGTLLFALNKRNLSAFDFMGRVAKFNSPFSRAVSWFKDNF